MDHPPLIILLGGRYSFWLSLLALRNEKFRFVKDFFLEQEWIRWIGKVKAALKPKIEG